MKRREASRQYYLRNKEKILAKRRIFREENREKLNEWYRNYYKENKEHVRKQRMTRPETKLRKSLKVTVAEEMSLNEQMTELFVLCLQNKYEISYENAVDMLAKYLNDFAAK